MPLKKKINVIDLFAGPGGLAEGFSSVFRKNNRVFKISLSIEKNKDAHKTLLLRSFYRQFPKNEVPIEYYNALGEKNLAEREVLIEKMFQKFKKEFNKAYLEAWHAELGNEQFTSEEVDNRIKKSLKTDKNWVLIGGPPCQAYSLVGRSRVGGIDKEDHRVYLYKEYLRIIAKHHPAVFVMENVKGLLSAKVNDEKVFHWMLKDLREPGKVFNGFNTPGYTIYSLVKNKVTKDSDYLIKCEKYGVPQKRHRVILLGIRNDIKKTPNILDQTEDTIPLKSVIEDLPKIRSKINRKYKGSTVINGKKKRFYENVEDSDSEWKNLLNVYRSEIVHWNGFEEKEVPVFNGNWIHGIGAEFIDHYSHIKKSNPLSKWYYDEKLQGVLNHQSRSHLIEDLKRYLFASIYSQKYNCFPRLKDYEKHGTELLPDHKNVSSGKFVDRFRVQLPNIPATTITSHISKDGHYFIHFDSNQCRSLTVREAARIQTFPDNYLFRGSRTQQFHQVGNAVPPYLSTQIGEIVLDILN